MAVVAIGDVHGYLAPLKDLTAQLQQILSADDVLVFLGDYIDKGPDTRGCVDHIIGLTRDLLCPVVTLIGNHEHYMLRTWKDPTDHSWIWFGGLETIESYSPAAAARIRQEFEEAGPGMVTQTIRINYGAFFDTVPPAHVEFFERLSRYYETNDLICVHAGMDPKGGPMNLQELEDLVWGTEGFPSEYSGERAVIYGHWDNSIIDDDGWPQPRILHNQTFGIDTISKGVLSAIRFPDQRLFQSQRWNH